MRSRPMRVSSREKDGKSKAILFNRPANLFALKEILNSVPDGDNENFEYTLEFWSRIIKYYLCVNDVVSDYSVESHNPEYSPFERLSAGQAFLNELNVVNDQLLAFSRGIDLFNYFKDHDTLGESYQQHFQNVGFTPANYVKNIFTLYFLNKDPNKNMRFYYHLDPKDEEQKVAIQVFEYLSRRDLVNEAHNLDVIEIKKSPVYNYGDNRFLIMDNNLMLEKLYELFINDFWFETVRPSGVDIRNFRSSIGYFFENYLSDLFNASFGELDGYFIKTLDQLKLEVDGNLIELADGFVRKGNKVLLAQFKSSGIYNDQQYGTAQSLFRNDENYLYNNFGLNQLIESIKQIIDNPKFFDEEIDENDNLKIYPALFVNEKIFQTPLFPIMFQLKFESLINEIDSRNYKIRKLAIIHISDFEKIKDHIKQGNVNIWKLLKSNYIDSLFPKPFYISVNRQNINPMYQTYINKLAQFMELKIEE